MRPKWDERRGAHTYGELTILQALARTQETYAPSPPPQRCNTDAAHPSAASRHDDPDHDHGDRRTKAAKEGRASKLVQLAGAETAELWHTSDGTTYATIVVDGVCQHWPLASRTFRGWLARRFYEITARGKGPGQAVSRDDLAAAVTILDGVARFDGATRAVFTRVAPDGAGGVYIDLTDDRWRAVHVTAAGWEIVTDPPVRFRRLPGQRPLPVPERGGALDDLRDLMIAARAGWVIALDNLSALPRGCPTPSVVWLPVGGLPPGSSIPTTRSCSRRDARSSS